MVLLLPITFVFVLGYAVEATRAADERPAQGPPPWRLSRIYTSGQWMSIALALLSAPFAIGLVPLAGAFHSPGLWHSSGALLDVEAVVAGALLLAFPWGLLLLVLMPHATARFAATHRARDLFNFAASVRSVRREFANWNLAVAAIVTAWAIGVACVGLFCVGIVPGIFYAILVSAHATASLHPEGADTSAR
jgi:hypothetical protein